MASMETTKYCFIWAFVVIKVTVFPVPLQFAIYTYINNSFRHWLWFKLPGINQKMEHFLGTCQMVKWAENKSLFTFQTAGRIRMICENDRLDKLILSDQSKTRSFRAHSICLIFLVEIVEIVSMLCSVSDR